MTEMAPTENSEPEGLVDRLSRVVSELTTALDLVVRAEERGQTVREWVHQEWESFGDLEELPPSGLALAALELTFRALERLGVSAFEPAAYCVEADPPSPYFRLGNVETCSHRPDHPRLVS